MNAIHSEWTLVTNKSNNIQNNPNIALTPPPRTTVIAKGDSAATNHYWALRDTMVLDDVRDDTNGPTVILPDTSTLTATKKGRLPIPNLSPQARKTAIFDNLQNSLISLGQLCDDNCSVHLSKHKLVAIKDNKILLQGTRSKSGDGLWDIPLPAPTPACPPPPQLHSHQPTMNIIIRKNQAKTDLIRYLHGCCFFPTKNTWIEAINNGHFISWPGLTAELVRKHLPPSIETAKGLLNQERGGLQSTTLSPPSQATDILCSHTADVIFSITNPKNKAYMDATGRFPHCSSRGNEYVLIGYHPPSNAILGVPLKNRQAATITKAWKLLHDQFSVGGLQPSTWILDNETSSELRTAMIKKKLNYQLVPPHNHRANAAERAIQSFKNHFKAGLASLDPDFPIAEWDRLLTQAFLTLNLLRTASTNPQLSAHASLFGQFDFNATPLAPPGTKVIVHAKPGNRGSWDLNGKDGWYIGPSLNHYRCMRCFLPSSRSEVDSDTLAFFPHSLPFPKVSTDDFLRQAAMDIVTILTNPTETTLTPTLAAGDETHNALLQLANLLNRNVLPPSKYEPLHTSTAAAAANLQKSNVSVKQSRNFSTPKEPFHNHLQGKFSPSISLPVKITHDQLARVLDKDLDPPRTRLKAPSTSTPSFRHRAARSLLAQHIFAPTMNHIYDARGKRLHLHHLLQGKDRIIWDRSTSNEFGRLANGNQHGVKGTNTIEFIHHFDLPGDKKVTYGCFVCNYRPLKSEQYRVRLVVGGDGLDYNEDAGAPAASMLETKILLNSAISDAHKGAKFFTLDIKDFFLATPMSQPEYMKIHIKNFPQDIIDQYGLLQKVTADGYVYVKIKKGMYGLKQAAVLAYDQLVEHLAPFGYYPCPQTTGIWRHTTRKTRFCLCVDDFGIKYFSKADADHLLNALQSKYKISTDWEGKNYCGLTLDWDYVNGRVDISMPGYIRKALERLQHIAPTSPQYAPHRWTEPSYGSKVQLAPVDTSPLLDAKGKKYVQSVTGTLAYYSRGVDPTMQPAINEIAAKQANPTESTLAACKMLLDYAYTYPNAKIRFVASKMILTADTDAAYLVQPNARSRYAGYFYLTDDQSSSPTPNGAICVICRTIRGVMRSAAEAECAGVFHNSQEAVVLRTILDALGHPQPPTRIKTDNSTANSFVKNNIRQRRSKTWDMRWNWLRDELTKKQINVFWDRGDNNDADYYTKHHPPNHHKISRPKYILQGHNVSSASISSSLRFRLACARVCSGLDR